MKILKISNLEKQDGHTVAFPPFDLELSANEVVAIHSNTNVRSIIIKLLLGEMPIQNGEIYIQDHLIQRSIKKDILSKIGFYLLDDGIYERLSIKDNLSFYKKIFHSPLSIDEALRAVQLEAKKNERVSKLSFSEQRRVLFGRLLFQDPLLYVFELPDQNVDLETKRVFIKLVRELSEQGKAILILTDNIESALFVTNHVFRLDEKGLHVLDVKSDGEDTMKETASTKEEEIISQPVRFEKIPTKVNDKIVLFDPPEIDYIESSEGQSTIYIKGDSYPSVFTLTELETRLLPYGFFRCHRSYIVNLQKVREVVTFTRNSFSLVLTNSKSIPLSKTKMAELKEMLGLK